MNALRISRAGAVALALVCAAAPAMAADTAPLNAPGGASAAPGTNTQAINRPGGSPPRRRRRPHAICRQ
jgi:hypothetical protein